MSDGVGELMFDDNAIKTMGIISKRFVEVACKYN